MSVKIIEVTSRSELNAFIKFPWKVYKKDKYWVPPLILSERKFYNPEKNPFFKHSKVKLFLAFKDGSMSGRISLNINDNYNRFHGEKIGFWGSFECFNDPETAASLLGSVETYFMKENIKTVRGPFTFSTNDTCGLLVEGFNISPMIMMPYNPEYYIDLIENNGYKKAKDLIAFKLNTTSFPEKLSKDLTKLQDRFKVNIRSVDFKKFDKEIEVLKEIYNDAWEKNWGFVPMTEEEFENEAMELKSIADSRFLLIAEKEGVPVGFLVALPDVNIILKKINGRLFPFGIIKLLTGLKKIDDYRIITLGVKKRYRKFGIDMLLVKKGFENNTGIIRNAELSWVLEDNAMMVKGIENIGGNKYKTYRIYEKKL